MHPAFADTPESRAWFDAIATVSDADADRIEVPETDTWRAWLEFVEVPRQDMADVIVTTPGPDNDPELYRILQRGAAYLMSFMGSLDRPVPFAGLADFNSPRYRYFYVQLLTACLPAIREYHDSRGMPEAISQATLADLGRNVRVHRKREGVGGLGVMWWLMLHFRGLIYQLGRLQFELHLAGDDIADSMKGAGIDASKETHVLSVHIPDFMGPMDYEACNDAIRHAMQFFPKHFPDWPVEYAICNSWLLDPQLKTILKPESNIIRFQERFTITNDSYDSSDSVMQFVFGRHLRDIDTISPKSSLERGILEHLRSGRKLYGRQGWFPLNDVPVSRDVSQ
jgi:hypothetical protein